MNNDYSPVMLGMRRWQAVISSITGAVVAFLILGNLCLMTGNQSTESEVAGLQEQNRRNQTQLAQTSDATRRVMMFLQSSVGRMTQAAASDKEFKEMLSSHDSSGVLGQLQHQLGVTKSPETK